MSAYKETSVIPFKGSQTFRGHRTLRIEQQQQQQTEKEKRGVYRITRFIFFAQD